MVQPLNVLLQGGRFSFSQLVAVKCATLFFLTYLACCYSTTCQSQNVKSFVGNKVLAQSVLDSTKVLSQQTFVQQFKLFHSSPTTAADYEIKPVANKYFKFINVSSKLVHLAANDTALINLKLLNVGARLNGCYLIKVNIVNAADSAYKTLYVFTVQVYNGLSKTVDIRLTQNRFLLEKSTQSFELPLVFKNNGLDTLHYHAAIFSQAPLFFVKLDPSATKPFHLPEGESRINLLCNINALRLFNKKTNNSFIVEIRDVNNDVVQQFNVFLHTLSSKVVFNNSANNIYSENNLVLENNFYYNKIGGSSNNFSISKALKAVGNGIGFNVNLQKSAYSAAAQLNNTFVDLRRGALYLKVGNISELHELNLSGRGVQAKMYLGKNNNRQIECWAIDQQYDLLKKFSTDKSKQVISLRYQQKMPQQGLEFSLSSNVFQDGWHNSKGQLYFGNIKKILPKHQTIALLWGTSIENFQHLDTVTSQSGFAHKLDYDNLQQKWQTHFSWYQSSRNYAGARQGTLLLDGYFRYTINRQSSLTYRLNTNNSDRPLYDRDSVNGNFYNNTTINEIQLQTVMFKNKIFIRPYLYEQGFFRNSNLNKFDYPTAAHSSRLELGMQRNFMRSSYVVKLDGGSMNYQKDSISNTIGSFKLDAFVSYKHFNFNLLLQQGPYYVYDVFNVKNNKYSSQAFNVGYQKKLLALLDYSMNFSFNHNSYSKGARYFMTQNLSWQIKPDFKMRGAINLSRANELPLSTQVNIGLLKTFSLKPSSGNNVALHLQIFEDINNDGLKQATEKWLPKLLIQIDEQELITDKRGGVVLKNVKPGNHTAGVIVGAIGQRNYFEKTFSVIRNSHIIWGIPRKFDISGIVIPAKNRFDSTKVDVESIRISFRDSLSNEYYALTTKTGTFSLQLPPGNYRAYLTALKKDNDNNFGTPFIVDPVNGYAATIELILPNIGRKAEVKTFAPR